MHQNLGKIVCKFSPFMHKEFIPGLGVSQNKEMVFFLIVFYRVQASVASTLIFLNKLPRKLNPIIRLIVDSIKKEEQTIMQVCVYFPFICLLHMSSKS